MRTTTQVVLGIGAVIACAAACSLGLDPSKIEAEAGVDAGIDVAVDAPNPVACKADPDCTSSNHCLTGKCVMGQCSYTQCPVAACNAAVCDPVSHTCSAPSTYNFHAGTFHVAQGNIGCGGGGVGARKCFAAVHPFVFVGTTNGVVAFNVENPTVTTASAIPVGGLPFFPNFIVASGSTIYFVGPVSGTGPTWYVPIATLAAPTDPTVTEMTATTVFDTMPYSSVDLVYPDASGGIYLVYNNQGQGFPSTHISAPLADLSTLSFSPLSGYPTTPVVEPLIGASGTRLVTFGQDGMYNAYFSLEMMAATPSATNGGAQNVTSTVGPTGGGLGNNYFGQGPTGGLVWSTDLVSVSDAGVGTYAAARVSWILQDGTATTFDGGIHVDMNTYSTTNPELAGPVAWVDQNTAIQVSAYPSNLTQSIVEVASRSGTPQVVMNRTFQLSIDPAQVAIVSSSGFGYVLMPDTPQGARVHIFDTACNM